LQHILTGSTCGVGNSNPPEAESKENKKEEEEEVEEVEERKSIGDNLGKKKRSMFGRRNTDAPRPEASVLHMEPQADAQTQKEKKKKGRPSAMKRRHTMADSKEMEHNTDHLDGHSGDNKKCILM
jgi:archaellum component FlaD/FlaE